MGVGELVQFAELVLPTALPAAVLLLRVAQHGVHVVRHQERSSSDAVRSDGHFEDVIEGRCAVVIDLDAPEVDGVDAVNDNVHTSECNHDK